MALDLSQAKCFPRRGIYYDRDFKKPSAFASSQILTMDDPHPARCSRSKTNNDQGKLVDGSQTKSPPAPWSLPVTEPLQSDRSKARISDQRQRSLSGILWQGHCRWMAYPRSYKDRGILQTDFPQKLKRAIANTLAQTAVKLGFANPREVDFDSTVQEANISYPSDVSLMTKLAGISKKLIDYVKGRLPLQLTKGLNVDIKSIKKQARDYFFLARNKGIEVKREAFKNFHRFVKHNIRPIAHLCEEITKSQMAKLPWNIKRAYDQIKNDAWRYLLDVAHFTRTHTIKAGKMLSFHAKELACIKKGKIGKDMEFGRVFQIGRIKGNFLFVLESTSVFMNDKQSFIPLLREHAKLFGENILETAALDKGYWSTANRRELQRMEKSIEGLQKPMPIKDQSNMDMELQERLRDRRAGIEPLIGHAKHGGQLARSRMKSDRATLAAGYGSILGLNLRQLIRYQQEKIKLAS